MRTALVLVSAALVGACASSPSGGDDGSGPDAEGPPPPSFTLTSPPYTVMPGQEFTLCYYFRTPNVESMAVRRWNAEMPAGIHHLIVYTTQRESMPPETMSASNCGVTFAELGNYPMWTYAANLKLRPQDPDPELVLPDDDGTGKPLALEIAANQSGFIQIHYKNSSDEPVSPSVKVSAEGLFPDEPYTKTAAYTTFNAQISIPPLAVGHKQALSCPVAASKNFWLMTTHTHKQGVRTAVTNRQEMVFTSDNWEHPVPERWGTGEFKTFSSERLTYECTWTNMTNRTITTGDNALDDEVCMASGYFFPADEPVLCINESPSN